MPQSRGAPCLSLIRSLLEIDDLSFQVGEELLVCAPDAGVGRSLDHADDGAIRPHHIPTGGTAPCLELETREGNVRGDMHSEHGWPGADRQSSRSLAPGRLIPA